MLLLDGSSGGFERSARRACRTQMAPPSKLTANDMALTMSSHIDVGAGLGLIVGSVNDTLRPRRMVIDMGVSGLSSPSLHRRENRLRSLHLRHVRAGLGAAAASFVSFEELPRVQARVNPARWPAGGRGHGPCHGSATHGGTQPVPLFGSLSWSPEGWGTM